MSREEEETITGREWYQRIPTTTMLAVGVLFWKDRDFLLYSLVTTWESAVERTRQVLVDSEYNLDALVGMEAFVLMMGLVVLLGVIKLIAVQVIRAKQKFE